MILTAIADRLGLGAVHTTASWAVLRKVGDSGAHAYARQLRMRRSCFWVHARICV
jgi:hypothetical protein